jgi:hypothetical protein
MRHATALYRRPLPVAAVTLSLVIAAVPAVPAAAQQPSPPPAATAPQPKPAAPAQAPAAPNLPTVPSNQVHSAPPARAADQTGTQPGFQRVVLPGGGEGLPFPYTIDVPADWRMYQTPTSAGVWLGPAGAEPGKDPRMVFVRISTASLADPVAVAANIRANDESNANWTAPVVEVREVAGVRGVLVRMDSGEGAAARSTLVLKLPLPKTSVDFMASAPRADFETLRSAYESILLSVRPVKP